MWVIFWKLHKKIGARSKEIWNGRQLSVVVAQPVAKEIMSIYSDHELTRDALRYATCCIPRIIDFIRIFGYTITEMFDKIGEKDWSMTPTVPFMTTR